MERHFLPVGQGAFYTESFSSTSGEKINIIYDCGSLTGLKFVKEQIDLNYKYGEKIHAVFISHFDEDHVNGLEYLLHHCQVERIFFPLLTEEDKYLLLLKHFCENDSADEDDFSMRFARDPGVTISKMEIEHRPMLYPIRPQDTTGEDIGDDQFTENSDYMPNTAKTLPSGENVSCIIFSEDKDLEGLDVWWYIPFHFREKIRRASLKKQLNQHLGTSDPKDLLKLLKSSPSYRKTIKLIYMKVPGGLNTNSMVLFSGPRDPSLLQYLREEYSTGNSVVTAYSPMAAGCLYMGDYEANGPKKWQELHSAYEKYLDRIGCLQVPHHGSQKNFNSLLLTDIRHCRLYFISAGLNYSHKHPDGEIIKAILYEGKRPAIITEQPESALHLRLSDCHRYCPYKKNRPCDKCC